MATNSAGVEVAGREVRRRRKLLGQDLVTFAPKAKISVQYLSAIETGTRKRVSPAVFVRICDALGIPQDKRETLLEVEAA